MAAGGEAQALAAISDLKILIAALGGTGAGSSILTLLIAKYFFGFEKVEPKSEMAIHTLEQKMDMMVAEQRLANKFLDLLVQRSLNNG